MRTEAEMMELILKVADQDDDIRAVAMNGSRANKNAPKDIFQDYDIVYLVRNYEKFVSDFRWVDIFGERIIMQLPDVLDGIDYFKHKRFHYLMQFADGNRIDLTILDMEQREVYCKEDSLTVILLDKDGSMPEIPFADDRDYWIKKPTESEFFACCNEFWWVCPYVAKGLWRKEFLYAAYHLENCVRSQLLQMLIWKVGIETGFSVSAGKCGKYLKNYLSPEDYTRLMSYYGLSNIQACWRALFSMGEWFRELAGFISQNLEFSGCEDEALKVTEFLNRIYMLPEDAQELM